MLIPTPLPYWPLIRKALPYLAVGLAVLGAWLYVAGLKDDRDDALAEVAALQARLAAVEAAGEARAEQARLDSQAWQNVATRLYEGQGESLERLAAITADNVSLAGRLRDHENRLRAGSLSDAAGGAGGNAGAPGESGGPRTADAALDAYDKACRRDAERLAYWQALWTQISPNVGTNGPN